LTVVATWALGSVQLLHGGWEEAEQRLAAALDLARERRVGLYLESSMLASLAEAAAGRGEIERAVQRAEEAVAAARRCGVELYECEALLVLARTLLSRGGGAAHAAATAALARAERQARAQGLGGLAARVHLAKADVEQALGREAHAAAERRAARAAFVAIGADALAARVAESPPHRAAS
jgi:ATP/maltotriose-dependent transcriptional regulator MalT